MSYSYIPIDRQKKAENYDNVIASDFYSSREMTACL